MTALSVTAYLLTIETLLYQLNSLKSKLNVEDKLLVRTISNWDHR